MGIVKKPLFKWFCQCVTVCDEEVYLVVRATTAMSASELVHQDYMIDYVTDIFTPLEMAFHKRHLAPTMIGVQPLIPWWTSATKGVSKKPKAPYIAALDEDITACSAQPFEVLPSTQELSIEAPNHADRERTRPPVSGMPRTNRRAYLQAQ